MTATSGIAGSSPLPKWQIALVFGAPVALGLGYMYYRNKHGNVTGSDKSSSRNKLVRSNATTKEKEIPADKQISIDGDCPKVPSTAAEPETPLQKAQNYKNKGNEHFKVGRYEKAIEQYNKAIEICPMEDAQDLATFYQNRAAAHDQLKEYIAVKEDCTKALELNPKYIKALLRRARILEELKDLESALEDITAACLFEGFNNPSNLATADRILDKLGRQHAEEHMAKKKFITPSKYIIKGYFRSFPNDPVFTRLSEEHSEDNPEFMKKLLQALKDEEYDDIIPMCTKIIESPDFNTLPSSRLEVLLLRGTFYVLVGKRDAALEDFTNILNSEDAPSNVKVYTLVKKATLHMQFDMIPKMPEMSFNDFSQAIDIDPNCAEIYYHRGQMSMLMNKMDDARNDFDKALRLSPDYGVAFVQKCYTDYRYAVVTRDAELVEAAMKQFQIGIEKFPHIAECYMLYAEIMTETQQYDQADMYFAKLLEKDPKNATFYVNRGLLQLQLNGNINKAVEYIQKAIEVDKKCELAYESLGSIEVQRGNIEEAIRLFEKALDLCRTPVELTHVYSLRDAAKMQLKIRSRVGTDGIPSSDLQNSCSKLSKN